MKLTPQGTGGNEMSRKTLSQSTAEAKLREMAAPNVTREVVEQEAAKMPAPELCGLMVRDPEDDARPGHGWGLSNPCKNPLPCKDHPWRKPKPAPEPSCTFAYAGDDPEHFGWQCGKPLPCPVHWKHGIAPNNAEHRSNPYLSADYAAACAERDSLRTQLADARAKILGLELSVVAAEKRIAELTQQLADTTKRAIVFANAMADLRILLDSAERRIAELEARLQPPSEAEIRAAFEEAYYQTVGNRIIEWRFDMPLSNGPDDSFARLPFLNFRAAALRFGKSQGPTREQVQNALDSSATTFEAMYKLFGTDK